MYRSTGLDYGKGIGASTTTALIARKGLVGFFSRRRAQWFGSLYAFTGRGIGIIVCFAVPPRLGFEYREIIVKGREGEFISAFSDVSSLGAERKWKSRSYLLT